MSYTLFSFPQHNSLTRFNSGFGPSLDGLFFQSNLGQNPSYVFITLRGY